MQTKIVKIIFAIAAATILAACNEDQDFYQASSVNSNYRSDQHAQTTGGSPQVGFYKGEPPKTGRGATGTPPSTTATATTSDAQVPAPAPSDAAPPSTTSVPDAAPAAVSSEVPPSTTTTAAPPSTAQ